MTIESPILAEWTTLQARLRPNAVAVQFEDRQLTYAELDARANCVAQGLIAAGCRPGARVGVVARNSDTFVEILMGALKARAVLLAVNWRLAAPEIRYILDHGEAEFLFVEDEFLPTVRAAAGARPVVVMGKGGYAAWRDANAAEAPDLAYDPADVIVQMYTSGTTGLPKGVQLTNHNYTSYINIFTHVPWQNSAPEDTMFAPAPFFHVNGINAVLRSIHSGSRLITIDQFRPAEAVATFAREKVTRATLAPAMIQMCLEVPGIEKLDFSHLKLITYGGSPIAERVMVEAGRVFGCRFAQGYGMTEATSAIVMLAPDDHVAARGKLKSCGRPLPGVEVRVVDADGKPCPPHGIGEVVVRGPVVTKGYWRDERATSSAIIDGWLHTGDAAYFDEEGYLYIHDRVKEMIVSGGENIYPAEVENALFHHPDVADAAVIGVPHEKWGEAVKALVVVKPGATLSETALIEHARGHIAGYKVPKSVEFVSTIPRNAAGKILRRELRKPYWENRERNVN
jgi:acyl-CoA synthetase (AMP-forming)/AMP-acid ligase II